MPRAKTPCPRCGALKMAESALCRSCSNADRLAASNRRCPKCGEQKSYYADQCRRCKDGTLLDRLVGMIEFTEDCWDWLGAQSTGMYGAYPNFRVGDRTVRVHRYVYERFVEPIPEDLQLDHLCRNTLCVNPDHLEPVTNAENRRRAAIVVTHCPSGHAYDVENTRIYQGRRYCKACKRERNAARQAA